MIILVRLEAFQIKNYKSIKNSGVCSLEEITILAGKNESGKTAILEALEDFNIDKKIRKDAIPIWSESLKPEISIFLRVERNELDEFLNKIKNRETITELELKCFEKIVNAIKKNLKNHTLKIIKKYPNDFLYSEEIREIFIQEFSLNVSIDEQKNEIRDLVEQINKLVENPIPLNIIDNLNQLLNFLLSYKPQVKFPEKKNELEKFLSNIIKIAEEIYLKKNYENYFWTFVKEHLLPNFILFEVFNETLPDEILINEVQNNPLFCDLMKICGLDLERIKSADVAKKEKHKEEINLKFKKEYEQFWTQDHANLFLTWEQSKISCLIKENGEFYKPKMRSKGKQWHLAFYIRVTARSIEERNNILLIDEPGLFLHAKAQRDILKKLEECSRSTQIIYSTHSPYLIPADKMNRIRLVIRDENNHSKITKLTAQADRETLTPILTAIGEDLSLGIRVDKKNSIVVEGFSDYIWLMAMKKVLSIRNEFYIIPSVGASATPYVGAILFGWGLEPIFILDNDRAGKDAKKKLKKKLAIDETRIILVPEKKEGSIESLFVNENFIPAENMDKILTAKQFYEKVKDKTMNANNLTEETKANFRELFNKINELLG